MLSLFRVLALALTVVSMYGCATSPVPDSQALAVPPQRLLAPDLTQPASGLGQLIVTRDSGAGGSACTAKLFVDARPVADIYSSEQVKLYLPAGDHMLGIALSTFCGGGLVEASVVIDQARPRRFRISFTAAQDLVLQPTAF